MNTNRHKETVAVIFKDQRHRRWSPAEEAALVKRTYEPGMSVSLVTRQEGVAASLLFQWRKLESKGVLVAVSAGEFVVPASELAAASAEICQHIAYLSRYGYPPTRHARSRATAPHNDPHARP